MTKIFSSKRGRVTKGVSFEKIPGDRNHIRLTTETGEKIVTRLPKGVKSNDKIIVGLGKNKDVIVEVKHETTDRRNIVSNNSSDDDLGI